ncbi:hypothetical protein ACFVW5_05855 [Streptomyces sp. NPDC058232]
MTPRTARVAAYEQCARHSLSTPLDPLIGGGRGVGNAWSASSKW